MTALSLTDGTLWYDDVGDGHPLVFVHGGWLNGRAWKPQLEYFTDEYRVITLDIRGHGHTGSTDADQYSIDLFADDLEAVLEAEALEDPILCGSSLGSMVVQTFLERHPDRAAGAILAGAVRSFPPEGLPTDLKPFVSPMPALASTLSMSGPRTVFRSLLYSVRSTTGKLWLTIDPTVREAALAAVGEIPRSEFRKIFGALYRYEPPSLEGVNTPLLVVHGEHEAGPVKRQGNEIVAAVSEGKRITIEDAGHLVNQDRPQAFNRSVSAFLTTLPNQLGNTVVT